ncbi:MAG TPA: hypothetical protein VL651_16990 [Bacteroidia bacterium]|jgi:hypothetical protein|nr:hypothetical protein [Bacteroidia bacterium]
MHSKLFFPAVITISLLFFQCGTDVTPGSKTDSVKTDTGNSSTHQLSVTTPSNAIPHAVKDSIYDGEHVERYDNGVVYMKGEVKGGLRHGEWMTFYKDGKLWSQGTYKDGFREGYGVSYYANGNKSSEGYYQHDKMIGKWTFWDEYGNATTKDFGAAK